jgi:prepilin-type N-terminal cleavage/methylation domain-containing protein
MSSRLSWRDKGFSLLEVVLAMALVSLALVPITHDLTAGLRIADRGDTLARNCFLAQAKMEELMAMDFDSLADASGTTILGDNLVWQVTVSLYDGDNDGDLDPGLKHISLQAGDIMLQTLRCKGQ